MVNDNLIDVVLLLHLFFVVLPFVLFDLLLFLQLKVFKEQKLQKQNNFLCVFHTLLED
jgi:hypothetical protein